MNQFSSFQASRFLHYGVEGRDSVNAIVAVLNEIDEKLSLLWNKKLECFLVTNSQETPREELETALLQRVYFLWTPTIQKEADLAGNKIIKLVAGSWLGIEKEATLNEMTDKEKEKLRQEIRFKQNEEQAKTAGEKLLFGCFSSTGY